MLFRSDRKSTRLNSSHTIISYAVFCLKKKNTPSHPLSRTCYPPPPPRQHHTAARGARRAPRAAPTASPAPPWALARGWCFFLNRPAPPGISPPPPPPALAF